MPKDTTALCPSGAAHENQRQIDVRVLVGVADTAPVKNEGMVKEIAVAIGRGLQLLEEMRRQGDVILVDLGALLELHGVVLVVRHRVVRGIDAKLWVSAIGLFFAECEHEHTRDVGLERERDQIEHQLCVLVIRLGHANRSVG